MEWSMVRFHRLDLGSLLISTKGFDSLNYFSITRSKMDWLIRIKDIATLALLTIMLVGELFLFGFVIYCAIKANIKEKK